MLVGRERERLAIDRLLAGARVGHSGVLVLTGEAGIGKTALVDHAAATAGLMPVLRATGSEPERDVPFAGLSQLLVPALELLDRIAGPQARALSVALALTAGDPPDRFAVGAATLALLSRFAEDRPLLLLVDDAHALDRPSTEALAFAARRLTADPIALLVACRPEPVTPLLAAGLPQITVEGLTPECVAQLAAARAGAPVPRDTTTRLHRATGGNPLAVLQLADDLQTFARLTPEALVGAPEPVVGWFAQRAQALAPSARAVLLLAAVLDGDLAAVCRAAPALGASVDDLAAVEDSGLVHRSAGRLVFRHPLAGSAAYTASAPSLRRAAHRAAAHALPQTELDRRAWHLCEATVGVDDAVSQLVAGVGERALARGAHAVAATAFERSALLAGGVEVRCARLLTAGEAAWLAGQVPRAQLLLLQAARLTTDAGRLSEIEGLSGNIQMRTGSLEEARRVLRTAADRVLVSDPDAAAGLISDVVLTCFFLGDAVTALDVADVLDEVLQRTRTDHARTRGSMTVGLAQVLAGEPGIERIRDAVEDLRDLPGWSVDRRRPSWVLLGPLFLRDAGPGREVMRHAVETLRGRSAIVTLPSVLFCTARDAATTDRWQAAESEYEEAVRLAREAGQTTDLAMCLAGLAWLQARTGDHGACRANADEAEALARAHQVHLARAWVAFTRGELDLSQGSAAAAVAHFEELDRLLLSIGVLDVDLAAGPELADALVRVGRQSDGRDVAAGYQRRAVAKGQPWAMARGERALAITSGETVAEEHFERALELHAATPDRFEEARTQLAYGAWLRRARRRVEARPPLRAALGVFDQVGARPWAELAAAELRATGETAHRRGDSAVDRLTPQEAQIAGMLAAGRTTREAAAALFLSPKTVEYHLRHVYAKLAVTSRAELAAALAGRGGGPT